MDYNLMNQCCTQGLHGHTCTRKQQGGASHVKDEISSQCISAQMPWKLFLILPLSSPSLACFLPLRLPPDFLSHPPSPASIKAERPVHSRVQPVSWARAGGWREGDGGRVKMKEEEGGFLMKMNRSPVLHHSWAMEGWRKKGGKTKDSSFPPFCLPRLFLLLSPLHHPLPPLPDSMSHRQTSSLDALRKRNVT